MISLHEILYSRGPLRRLSLAELSRFSPVAVVLPGDDLPQVPPGTRVVVVGHDLRDPDGRVERAFRAAHPAGPYVVKDGAIMLAQCTTTLPRGSSPSAPAGTSA